jgi:hypothetical protein
MVVTILPYMETIAFGYDAVFINCLFIKCLIADGMSTGICRRCMLLLHLVKTDIAVSVWDK